MHRRHCRRLSMKIDRMDRSTAGSARLRNWRTPWRRRRGERERRRRNALCVTTVLLVRWSIRFEVRCLRSRYEDGLPVASCRQRTCFKYSWEFRRICSKVDFRVLERRLTSTLDYDEAVIALYGWSGPRLRSECSNPTMLVLFSVAPTSTRASRFLL